MLSEVKCSEGRGTNGMESRLVGKASHLLPPWQALMAYEKLNFVSLHVASFHYATLRAA